MSSRHSIRFRLTVAVGLLFGTLAALFAVSAYVWFRASLEEELRELALHEIDEVAQVVAGTTRLDPESRATLDRLMPESEVLALEVWSLDGERVYAHPASAASVAWPAALSQLRDARVAEPGAVTQVDDGVRAARLISFGEEPRWIAMALVSRAEVTALLSEFRRTALIAFGAVTILVLSASYWVLGRALQPVQDLVRDAVELSARASGGRLDVPPVGSELADLAALLNRMLAQTEESLRRLRSFTANAGHELRTPLARMRAEVESALTPETPEKLAAVLAYVLEEIESMRVLLDGLLDLARGEEQLRDRREEIDLCQLVSEVAGEAALVAEERDVSVRVTETTAARVSGSRALLSRLLWNLVDNALQATSPKGHVELRIKGLDGFVAVEVEDDGHGIVAERPEALFEPFVRGELSNARRGHGLGLALGRAIARRHGGDLEWMPQGVLGGARIRLRLPRIPPPPS